MGKVLRYNNRGPLAEELQSLHRHRHQLLKQLTQLCNRAESTMAGVFPELGRLMSGGLRSKTMWYILEHCPLPADVLGKGEIWLDKHLKKVSGGQFKDNGLKSC